MIIVLRAFRLVRLVKFLRGFPELQKQVFILLDIVKSVLALLALLAVTLLIFAVLGMNLFGGKLTSDWDEALLQRGSTTYVDIFTGVGSSLQKKHTHGVIRDLKTDPETGQNLYRYLGCLGRAGKMFCSRYH